MAQETVNCRLDRIPVAEGCRDDGCNNGNCSDQECATTPPAGEVYEGGISAPMSIPVPPADSPPATGDQQGPPLPPPAPSAQQDETPFRTGFGDRYRAVGGKDTTGRILQESAISPAKYDMPESDRSVKADSRRLLELIRASR